MKTLGQLLSVVLALSCGAAQAGVETTTFIIEKVWDQRGDTDSLEVTARLNCTGALSTQQDVVFTATTDAVLFVYDIDQIPIGQQVNCNVTEDVPENYRANYECDLEAEGDCYDSDQAETRCAFPDVDPFGTYYCTITNTPDSAKITVTKSWVLEGASQGFDGGHTILGECNSEVVGGTSFGKYKTCNESSEKCYFAESRQEEAVEGVYEFTIPNPNYPYTDCVFDESTDDSVVDVDNGCGGMKLGAGGEIECEIVNTVFFEGIPTLNQYGMAILALLMLGVGFVGFRRIV